MSRPVSRPLRARIDLAALRHNHGVARRHAGAARLWSVVKANAYGHGLERAARALREVADGFALIELEAAVALRASGVTQPILMLEGCYAAEALSLFAEHSLMPVLHCPDQIGWLTTTRLARPLSIYLKLNSGMNRLGLDSGELPAALAMLEGNPNIDNIVLMTHFADADGACGVAAQLAAVRAICDGLPYARSLANSAALLHYPETVADWARPGIMLYGGSPFGTAPSAAELDLKPVMTLESEVIAVRDLKAGDAVGYGCAFVADRAMRVGVVACGYADGYPRHAPTGTPVLVGGQRTRTLGRVSMDKLCVDLEGLAHREVGAPVTLWGRGLAADEVAAAAGTISYELFCALAPRVPVIEENGG